jgi:hypothetical protein
MFGNLLLGVSVQLEEVQRVIDIIQNLNNNSTLADC